MKVLYFKKYNNTVVDIGIVAHRPVDKRIVRIFNGEAFLVTESPGEEVKVQGLCAGKVSCAAFVVDADLAAALVDQAVGNLTAIGVEVDPEHLEGHTATVGRSLRQLGHTGSTTWVAATNPDGTTCYRCELMHDLGMYPGGAPAGHAMAYDGRRLGQGDACEDAPNELVAKITEEGVGRRLSSCAEVAIAGGCAHEMAKMHCPASCGLCDELAAQVAVNRRSRQLAGKCPE